MTGTVLVTDGTERAALAVVRDLGHAGFRCVVTSPTGRSLAGASRHAAADVAVVDALADPARYAEQVAAVARDVGATLVFPVGEASLLSLLPHREALLPAIMPFASEQVVRAALDKAYVLRLAADCGIAVPRQLTVEHRARAESSIEKVASWPVVLKPARSIGEARGRRAKATVRYATTPDQLRAEMRTMPDTAFPLLLQEYVAGLGVGTFHLWWGGQDLASFAHRRLREKPPSGGVSVYSESIEPPDGLMAASRRLLAALGWEGVAMVEYKTPSDGRSPVLMEINGRFWGSLQLAIDSGIRFPSMLARAALGEVVPPRHQWTRRRLRWWLGDVDHLLITLRGSDPGAGLAAAAGRPPRPSPWMPWRPGDRGETFRIDDPLPFARELARWLLRR